MARQNRRCPASLASDAHAPARLFVVVAHSAFLCAATPQAQKKVANKERSGKKKTFKKILQNKIKSTEHEHEQNPTSEQRTSQNDFPIAA